MELSKRLFAVSALVTSGNSIADIGTDHAYIPIYLMEKEQIVSAVAADVNRGPLLRAREHIEAAGFGGRIETRLSDGFEKFRPFEVESAVLAGMGGGLVMKILSRSPEVTGSLRECILQPQSEIAKVRAFLLENGFSFADEDMVWEDGKYYPMMKVIPKQAQNTGGEEKTVWNETELRYGKLLLKKKHPVLFSFLRREEALCGGILEKLREKSGSQIEKRKAQLQEDLYYIQKGLEYYEM